MKRYEPEIDAVDYMAETDEGDYLSRDDVLAALVNQSIAVIHELLAENVDRAVILRVSTGCAALVDCLGFSTEETLAQNDKYPDGTSAAAKASMN